MEFDLNIKKNKAVSLVVDGIFSHIASRFMYVYVCVYMYTQIHSCVLHGIEGRPSERKGFKRRYQKRTRVVGEKDNIFHAFFICRI